MIKKKHKEFKLADLVEGNTRMVDPYVNPNKDEFTDDEELGINPNITHKKHRWMVDTFKGEMGMHKTPQLKSYIKQCLLEVLNESMTFYPSGRVKEYDFTRLMEISFALNNVFSRLFSSFSEFDQENFRQNRRGDLFTPDGTRGFDDPTGIINFYVGGMSKDMITKTLKEASKFLKSNGMEFTVKADKSQMYDSDVYRINITTNPSKPTEETPEVKYANANMNAILRALGYNDIADDYGGEIDAAEFLRISNTALNSTNNFSDHERPMMHPDRDKFLNKTGQVKGPKFYDSGLDSDEMERRIKSLQQVAMYAVKHGNGKVSIG
jgi:hypothetical protein